MKKILLMAATAVALTTTPNAQAGQVQSIVLVHGAFVDGSGWRDVYNILKTDGYNVSIVQNPTESLKGDVAVAKRVIDTAQGSVLLVGHSYGGAVITEAGNDPKVAGLVYVAAFMADSQTPWGLEAVGGIIAHPAWQDKPSWYIIAKNDKMIPPSLQHAMAERAHAHTTEITGSHAIYVSQPKAVAAIIEEAAHMVSEAKVTSAH